MLEGDHRLALGRSEDMQTYQWQRKETPNSGMSGIAVCGRVFAHLAHLAPPPLFYIARTRFDFLVNFHINTVCRYVTKLERDWDVGDRLYTI